MEWIFAVFAVIGAIDLMTGNHLKLGKEFEKGILTCGPLIVSMAGIIVLAPVLSQGLSFLFEPMLTFLHMDTSVLSSLFAVDAGGAVMAREFSGDSLIGRYNGIIVASMFGATICPGIPVSMQMVDKEHHGDVLMGLLCGFATIPIGCIIGGLMAGCNIVEILINSVFIIVLSLVICIGLIKAPKLTQAVLNIIGKILFGLVIFGLAVGIFTELTGVTVIPGIAPLNDAFAIVGGIIIILAGVFPLLAIVSRLLKPVFAFVGNKVGIGETSVLGLITSLVNYFPMFTMIKDMNRKGRIMNMAFLVSGSFAFGDHLAFTLSYDPEFALPMVVGKLISGIIAVLLAEFVYRRISKKGDIK